MNQTLWGIVNTFVRISALLFIMKGFVSIVPGMRWVAWLLLLLCTLFGLAVFLEIFLICRPMAVDWSIQTHGTCGDQVVSYLVLEVIGLLLDFIILAIPILCIRRLNVKLARKMSIASLFMIGGL